MRETADRLDGGPEYCHVAYSSTRQAQTHVTVDIEPTFDCADEGGQPANTTKQNDVNVTANSSTANARVFRTTSHQTKRAALILAFKRQLLEELYITGEYVWRTFTFAPRGRHLPIFTTSLLFILFLIFCTMIGQYDAFIMSSSPTVHDCVAPSWSNTQIGPSVFLRYVFPGNRNSWWCGPEAPGTFDGDFLIRWGARWGPLMKAQPARWFTSSLLHMNFSHLLSNSALFAALSGLMEVEHGGYCIGFCWMISALGGNLMSAIVENPCTAVVGASGGIYGLCGMFFMEMILNWRGLKRKILRIIVSLSYTVSVIVSLLVRSAPISYFSHVGGFITGIIVSPAIAPNSFSSVYSNANRVLSTIALVSLITTLYLYFYLSVFPILPVC